MKNQIKELKSKITIENIIVILFNILITSIVFRYAYKKHGFT